MIFFFFFFDNDDIYGASEASGDVTRGTGRGGEAPTTLLSWAKIKVQTSGGLLHEMV